MKFKHHLNNFFKSPALLENWNAKVKYLEEQILAKLYDDKGLYVSDDGTISHYSLDDDAIAITLDGVEKEKTAILASLYAADPVCVKTKGKKTPFVEIVLKWWLNGSFRPLEDDLTVRETLQQYRMARAEGQNLDPIESFDNASDLYKYLNESDHNPDNRYETYLKSVYSNNTYTIFRVTEWEDCERAFKDSGWCVRHRWGYDTYGIKEFFLIVETKTRKRVALLHTGSDQLMDVYNHPINDDHEVATPEFVDLVVSFLQKDADIKPIPLEGDLDKANLAAIKSATSNTIVNRFTGEDPDGSNSVLNHLIQNIVHNPLKLIIVLNYLYPGDYHMVKSYIEQYVKGAEITRDHIISVVNDIPNFELGYKYLNSEGLSEIKPEFIKALLHTTNDVTDSELKTKLTKIVITYAASSPFKAWLAPAQYTTVSIFDWHPELKDVYNNIVDSFVNDENNTVTEDTSEQELTFLFKHYLFNDNTSELKYLCTLIFNTHKKLSYDLLRLLCFGTETRQIEMSNTLVKITEEVPLGRIINFSHNNEQFIMKAAKKGKYASSNMYIKFLTDHNIEDPEVTETIKNLPDTLSFEYSNVKYRALNNNHHNMFKEPRKYFIGDLNEVASGDIIDDSNVQEFLSGDIRNLYSIVLGDYARKFGLLDIIKDKYTDQLVDAIDPLDYPEDLRWVFTDPKVTKHFLAKVKLGKSYTNLGGVIGFKLEYHMINAHRIKKSISAQCENDLADMEENKGIEFKEVYFIPKSNQISILFIGEATRNTPWTRTNIDQNVAYFIRKYGKVTYRYYYSHRGRIHYDKIAENTL